MKKVDTVLLLNMSTIAKPLVNYYCDFLDDEHALVFEGISQLEAGTKSIIERLALRGIVLDRIIVTCSPDSLKVNSKLGMSAFDYYKKRIIDFCRGVSEEVKVNSNLSMSVFDCFKKRLVDFYHGVSEEQTEREVFDGNAILEKIRERGKDPKYTAKRDLLNKLEQAEIVNNSDLMAETVELYNEFQESRIIPVRMEGIGTNDAETIRTLRNDIIGSADFVNVYIDLQGGDRSFTYVLNDILALCDEKELRVQRVNSIDFFQRNIVNRIVDNIDAFNLVRLITAIKAFVNYGRGDLLVSYFNDKGYEKDSHTYRFVSHIQGISDALQISDPAGLEKSIEGLSEVVSEEQTYEDPFLSLVAKDIIDDYGPVLGRRNEEEDDSIIKNLDIIDWCAKKGFIQQGLTFIEDKMPSYFMRGRVISIDEMTMNEERADHIDNITGNRKLIQEATGAFKYETDIDRLLFYTLYLKAQREAYIRYVKLMKEQMAADICDELFPKTGLAYINTSDDLRLKMLKKFINDWKDYYDNVFYIVNFDIVSFIQYEYDVLAANKEKISKEERESNVETIIGIFTGQEADGTISPEHDEIFDAVCRTHGLNESIDRGVLPCNLLLDSKETHIASSIREWLCDASILSSEIRKYLLQEKNCLASIERQKSDQFKQSVDSLKYSETLSLIQMNSWKKEKDAKKVLSDFFARHNIDYDMNGKMDGFITAWVYNDASLFEEYKAYRKQFAVSDDRIAELYNNLNAMELRDLSGENEVNTEAVRYYIQFRTLEKEFEKDISDPVYIGLDLMNILSPKFDYNVNLYGFSNNGKNYSSWAGIRDGFTYKYRIGNKDDGYKEVTAKGHMNSRLIRNRDDLELIFRLHDALKQERNNSNHASEKGRRLNVSIVKYMMQAYIRLCEKYISGPLGDREQQ